MHAQVKPGGDGLKSFMIFPVLALMYCAVHYGWQPLSLVAHANAKFGYILNFFLTYVIIPTFTVLFLSIFFLKSKKIKQSKTRGSEVKSSQNANNELEKGFKSLTKSIFGDAKHRIYLGREKVLFPRPSESEGMLLLGQQGSGKTQAILSIIEQVEEAKETMIIYDVKDGLTGDFFGRYYREGQDYLLHTADSRCLCWNLMAELRSEADIDFAISNIVVSNADSMNATSEHFQEQVRILLKAAFLTVIHTVKSLTNRDLIDFLLRNDTAERFSEACTNAGAIQKYGLSVSSVLTKDAQGASAWASANRYFTRLKNRNFYHSDSGFSISDFIAKSRDKNADCRLFVVNPTETQELNRIYFKLFFSFISRSIRSLPTRLDRRIWLFLDEFQTLGKMSEMVEQLPAEARSKGACLILASQNLAKIKEVYGENLTNAILSGAKTKLIFSLGDDYSLGKIEKILGEKEVEETHYGISKGHEMDSTRHSQSASTKMVKTVLGSEISSLPKLCAYYQTAHILTKINFEILKIPNQTQLMPAAEPPFFGQHVQKTEPEKDDFQTIVEQANQDLILEF